MSYEHLLYETDGPIAVLTLNRPDKLNAWTRTMEREIREAIASNICRCTGYVFIVEAIRAAADAMGAAEGS